MNPIRFVLRIPGPPMSQPRHRATKRGKFMHIYDPASEDKQTLGQLFAYEVKRQGWPVMFRGAMQVQIIAVAAAPASAPKKRLGGPKVTKPDADNIAKFYLDAANGIVWDDDAHIVDLHVRKRLTRAGEVPHVTLLAEPLHDDWTCPDLDGGDGVGV